jgi:hypothetical protein
MSFPLTVVSGYWIVKNKHDDKFLNWFKNTLSINCPYVFFGTKETIELAKQYRKDLPTHYIELEIHDFFTYAYKDKLSVSNSDCPSTELNLIWNEKLFLIKKAIELNLFHSDFFLWADAGLCVYRDKEPPNDVFPAISKLETLPKDKFIFTSSISHTLDINKMNNYNYHHIAGTSYLFHKDFIDIIIPLYKNKLNNIDPSKMHTDQIILTLIYKENPDIFYKLGDGYGEVVPLLYQI